MIVAEKGETNPDELEDPLPFNHDIHAVIQSWSERRAHGIYPEPGGLFDQDSLLLDDWSTMALLYVRVQAGIVLTAPLFEETELGGEDWGGVLSE